ncbi:twin-arginine translocase TatA/TatE family subunit [Salinibius halmophilus]|uniref:twin-arginine translocase TatA/TatE family subunit n=1 Tax=Salinibius halmophilus TaxID=1853216 RepID=UPI000E670F9B|nr:twin-arginine translocase TatA/TatE family subunit [Salinibius halmophilus]
MFAGMSIWQLVIIAVIVIAIFGTKKLRNMGSDVGGAVKDFKKAMHDEESKDDKKDESPAQLNHKEGDANFSELNSQKEKDKQS